MVCPCRVILAAVSAFVAVFLILHTTRDNSETTDQAADDTKVPLKGGCRVSALHERWSWHTVADLFTGHISLQQQPDDLWGIVTQR
ncbi:hypothetical protein WJX77_004340 [Trebouxia sp. C0004]